MEPLKLDWKKSEVHLLLLSKFLKPDSPSNYRNAELWKEVLKENPSKAIDRFVREGYLVDADLFGHLDCKYTASQIKLILKEKHLKVQGNKPDLIKRLIASDLEHANRLAQDTEVYVCSNVAFQLVEKYLIEKKIEKDTLVGDVLNCIKDKRFEKASRLVAAYEAKQVFPRGMNIDWNNYNPKRDAQILTNIFSKIPKRLVRLPEEKIRDLRIASAMKHLFNETIARKSLPNDFDLGVDLDLQPALNLFWIGAMRTASLENYRQNSDVVIDVKILCADDSCEECKKLSGITYHLNDVPTPDDVCTNRKDCRCCYIPVTILNRILSV